MPIGKNSINRVAAGLDGENVTSLTAENTAAVTLEVEKKIVESTAAEKKTEKAETEATAVEKKIVGSTAKKTAPKKPAADAEKNAPELVGQTAAAPAPKKRGRKPGSKNKKKTVAATPKTERKTRTRRPRNTAFSTYAIGEELPVHLL